MKGKTKKGGAEMLSWQIDELVKRKNNMLNYIEYLQICDSPQIDHILYDAYSNGVTVWSDDGFVWSFAVENE